MLAIRPYRPEDFPGIERVHDRARRVELRYAGLEDAFLPLRIAAEREDLVAYPGLFVAELGAKALYARLGFVTAATERGRMPGNEAFSVQVDCMERC